MNKADKLDFLEDERKKLWQAILELDEKINKRTPEYESEAKQSSKKASEYRNRSEESRNTILQYQQDSQQTFDKITAILEDINILRNEIVSNSEFIANNAALTSTVASDIEHKNNEIQDNIQELEETFGNLAVNLDKINKLEELVAKSEELSAKIETIHKNTLVKRKEIDEVYFEIIGYTETDTKGEETAVAGLKDELENSYNELKSNLERIGKELTNYKSSTIKEYEEYQLSKEKEYSDIVDNWKNDYVSIVKKIEDLLPKALTTGLSYAYSEKKNEEASEAQQLSIKFQSSINCLVVASIIPFIVSIYSMFNNKSLDQVILDMPRVVLSILPLYIPFLWLAYSTSKKLNLSKRLVEEYTHKEVLSKTFEGLSRQIDSIEDNTISSELRTKLLFNILEVSSENPGKLISDYNKADHPLMDALDKSVQLANAVEKLAKIPGFSKITSSLEKKSRVILEEKTHKANAGLASISKASERGAEDDE